MLQVPAELFGLSDEPVLLVRNGRSVFANKAAEQLFGSGCGSASVRTLLGAELAGLQSPSCMLETQLQGRRWLVRVQSAEGLRLYLFRPAEHAPQELNEAFRYALRCCLMELNVSHSLLQDRAEQLADELLLAPLSSLSRSFFRLSRIVANLSIIQNAALGMLPFHPVQLDLCTCLRDLVDSVSVLFPVPELRLRLPETLKTAADPSLAETLVLNLLSNTFLHARGCTRVCLSLYEAHDQIILSVDDDGCGIPPSELQHVFDRYRHGHALSALAKGAGFGLTAVREIAHIHGGTLLLESREGSGTAVRVSMSRALAVPHPVQDAAGAVYERSYNSILTGLADCLPPSAFTGTYLS